MKRTRDIHHASFRKSLIPYSLAPLALVISSILLVSGCDQQTDSATMYKTVEDCRHAQPDQANQCQAAFQHAQQEAARTAPKYQNRADCVAEFGEDQCQQMTQAEPQHSGSFWMPLMAGYMMGRMLNNRPQAQPLFTPRSATSPGRGQFVDASGRSYGAATSGRTTPVTGSTFTPKPSSTNTITRGGFGRTVANQATVSSRAGNHSMSHRSLGG